jgi:DNA-binding FadR family transcriptional regulator
MPLPDRLHRPETTVEACARALRAAILAGELAVGERLPPERQLADRYGVNRITIRSALGRLAAARLIQTRQGSGHVVRDYLRQGGPDLLGGLLAGRSPDEVLAILRDLLRVRRHLARGVLEAFAEGAEAPDTQGVREAIERFAAAAAEDPSPERMAEADLEVFTAIVAASGSPVFQLCLNPIVSALRDIPLLRQAIYVDPAHNLTGWRGLLAWLESPDPDGVEFLVTYLAQGDARTVDTIRELLESSP